MERENLMLLDMKKSDKLNTTIPFQMVSETGIISVPFENLDNETSRTLKANLDAVAPNCKNLIIDLNQVKFMDSSGIGIILSCQRDMNKKKGELKLCSLNKPVRALLEMVRMNKALDIFNSLDEAIASFQPKKIQ
ncbi:MAG: STAS domain-containing protein [Candidatus Riflebacteria bacterium]|nr:STAS domain-containing protein [Candidatus Riflebacteria bacterium]